MKLFVAVVLVAVTLVNVECAKGPLVTEIVCGKMCLFAMYVTELLGIL